MLVPQDDYWVGHLPLSSLFLTSLPHSNVHDASLGRGECVPEAFMATVAAEAAASRVKRPSAHEAERTPKLRTYDKKKAQTPPPEEAWPDRDARARVARPG